MRSFKGCDECTSTRVVASTGSWPWNRPPPVRIGFVLTELIGGGAERSMLSIIDALDRTRFEPVLVLFGSRLDHAPPPGRADHRLWSAAACSDRAALVSRVFQLKRVIARERLDLLVSFLVGPNIVSIAAARLAGVPVVSASAARRASCSRASNRATARPWRLEGARPAAVSTRVSGDHQYRGREGRADELPRAFRRSAWRSFPTPWISTASRRSRPSRLTTESAGPTARCSSTWAASRTRRTTTRC